MTKLSRASMPINSAGHTFMRPIKQWLEANPNSSLKDIGANFSAINFHSLRYHISRAVKFNYLTATADNIPLYSVASNRTSASILNQLKEFYD